MSHKRVILQSQTQDELSPSLFNGTAALRGVLGGQRNVWDPHDILPIRLDYSTKRIKSYTIVLT